MQDEVTLKGLEDGGHVLLVCSNCDKPLVDVWITMPSTKLEFSLQASCCFCGDKSFIKTVSGGFHLGNVDGCIIEEITNVDVKGKPVVSITTKKCQTVPD